LIKSPLTAAFNCGKWYTVAAGLSLGSIIIGTIRKPPISMGASLWIKRLGKLALICAWVGKRSPKSSRRRLLSPLGSLRIAAATAGVA
jgi:hypothetical protein